MTEPIAHVHSSFGGEAQPGDIAPYVLLPTDAGQVEKIITLWDSARKISHHYEFLIYTGTYQGLTLTACSTGLGGMSLSIAIEELARLGANTFLHLGLAEPLTDEPPASDLIIAKGAARFDGTSHDYARPEFPALAHFEVVMAALAAAEQAGVPHQVGVVASLAASGPRASGKYSRFLNERLLARHQALRRAGVFGGSGQEATLFTLATVYGFRAGAIVVREQNERGDSPETPLADRALAVSVEAMRILGEWDRAKRTENLMHTVPPIG